MLILFYIILSLFIVSNGLSGFYAKEQIPDHNNGKLLRYLRKNGPVGDPDSDQKGCSVIQYHNCTIRRLIIKLRYELIYKKLKLEIYILYKNIKIELPLNSFWKKIICITNKMISKIKNHHPISPIRLP